MLLNSAMFVASLNNLLKESVIISSLHAFTVTQFKRACKGPYHVETSPLNCIANHSKMIGTFAMKDLKRVVLVV